jgi:hypothetical protein
MKAQQLLNDLLLMKREGHDLSKIEVYYRKDFDSDVLKTSELHEDLFDSETNNILKSIVIIG